MYFMIWAFLFKVNRELRTLTFNTRGEGEVSIVTSLTFHKLASALCSISLSKVIAYIVY